MTARQALLLPLLIVAAGCKTTATQSGVAAAETDGASALGPQDPGYEAQTGCAKQAVLWQNIQDADYGANPRPWSGTEALPVIGDAILDLFPLNRPKTATYFNVTMENTSDEMPPGSNRKKLVHSLGTIAKVRFIPASGSPYTGLYQGVDCGLARLSQAAKPIPGSGKTAPGMGAKFLIDGQPSMNFVAMYSLDGQKGENYFQNQFTSIVPPPASLVTKALANVFGTATVDPKKVNVKYMAKMSQNGATVASPHGPVELYLVPNPDLTNNFPTGTGTDFRDLIAQIAPPGTKLWDVYGSDTESADPSERTLAGQIVTTSPFVASSYGDDTLFLRHQRFESDDGVGHSP